MTIRTPLALEIRGLVTSFATDDGRLTAVDGLDLELRKGDVLALVGESGCGKSVTALSVLGLLQQPAGRGDAGEIIFDGRNLLELSEPEMRKIRGKRISMIFQDALTALNPVHRVGDQLAEMILTHEKVSKKAARARSVELLDLVGIPNAKQRARDHVHQYSGGMRQRAMIAMAVALQPDVLIADEPTTALDVTVQAQVLELLAELRTEFDTSMILITHDLGVVAQTADRVAVMYAGRKVEEQPVHALFSHPEHPYTIGLLGSMPRLDTSVGERLTAIDGTPPNLLHPPPGCRFAPRCDFAIDDCITVYPESAAVGIDGSASCHRLGDPVLVEARLAAGIGVDEDDAEALTDGGAIT